MVDLIAVQPNFEIKVNTWGMPGDTDIKSVIRRNDWYGTADINVVVDGTVADGVVSVVALEFRRYRLQYHGSWRDVSVEHDTIRVYANTIDAAMNKTLEWIGEHPEYTEDRPDKDAITAFHTHQKDLEYEEWKTKHV